MHRPGTIGRVNGWGAPETYDWRALYAACKRLLPGARRWKPRVGQPVWLANLLAAKLPRLPQAVVYALLIGSCLVLYFIDISQFAFLPYATKVVVVGTLTTLPMLFSGIIFIRSFTAVKKKDAALGANLIGGLVGGATGFCGFFGGSPLSS